MLDLTKRAALRFPATANFKVTSLLIDEIVKELKTPRANPVKISARFGVPPSLVRYVLNELPQAGSSFSTHSEDGWGRENLRGFIIARKRAGSEWTNEDQEVIQPFRDQYDEGTIEMAQGRDGDFIIQYAFPRQKPAKRENKWFQLELEG